MTSISTFYNMAACAAGVENQEAINKAISPKGLLEHIINFFTFGCVRKDNKELYRQINDNIMQLINSSEAMHEFTSTGTIALNDIQGCKVTFTLPGNNNENGMVIVTVSKGKHEEKGEVPSDKFKSSLATTMMRRGANTSSTIVKDNGEDTCFAFDDHYIDDNVEDYISTLNIQYDPVDSAIDEALGFLDIQDVNNIIQEGGIFSVSSKDIPVQPSWK
ncbi:hypothetical protein [Candidatus Symbiopectobacterium sp. NZEC151]|uniref:hypothetical protein n=1 Tax=Candidatus Symbiopectobacterium sp. NZEC151 TaxID=2820470 RepID=UPI002225B7B1|nr:hypothetical protein [Candidatus Symbiopectobacterium sp. NZEC151]MCW2473323.1 hypothetical protein [Candidatus Symbiopectobacterium sp. NZEC151]